MQLRILCVHIETSSLWAEFVNKNRCISVLLLSEEVKSIKFVIILIIHIIVSYDQNISLIFFMWKMDPMSGFDIRRVFTLLPRDSTLQYKRCVNLWNNFPCIITLDICIVFRLQMYASYSISRYTQFSKCLHHIATGMTIEQDTDKKDLNEDQGWDG